MDALVNGLRARAVRLLYRILDRNHPRGWIDVRVDTARNDHWRIFTEGLGRFSLPELEMRDCPADAALAGYGHGALYLVISALQLSTKEGREIGPDQIVDVRATEEAMPQLVKIKSAPERPDVLWLSDVAPESGSRFPSAFMAQYITEQAAGMGTPKRALEALELAAAIHAADYPYDDTTPSEADLPAALARSNAMPFLLKSDALLALGREREAFAALEEGIARAPYMAEDMKAEQAQEPDPNMPEALAAFWCTVDPWALQAARRAARQAD